MRRNDRRAGHARGGRHRWRAIAITVALGCAWAPVAAENPRSADSAIRIEISARLIESFDPSHQDQRRFGSLEFRGGLELTSSFREFGGLSALRMMEDGERFISLSDKGWWLSGRLRYANGRPVGIADAQMAPILGPDGRTIHTRGWYDTESIAEDGGTVYVGIERVNRILRFDFGKFGVAARGQPIPVPPGVTKLPANKSLEALAFVPKGLPHAGTLIAISERGLDAAGNLKAFLIGGPNPGEFSIKRRDNFDVTDAVILPSDDLLVLERRFAWTSGVAMRLRRIRLGDIAPDALVDGRVLLFADMGYQIDNMEGLGVHRDSAGDLILTMVSDDNFSILQRTLLLQFRLVEE